jgi:hypothetical protein
MGGPLYDRRTAVKRPLSDWGVRIHCLSFHELIHRLVQDNGVASLPIPRATVKCREERAIF